MVSAHRAPGSRHRLRRMGGPRRARSGIAKHLKGGPTVYLRKWVQLLATPPTAPRGFVG
jgi:hypothetical protein